MKAYTKNLLSINRNAFRFLHDTEGFDFEKPYFITEQPGKFTVNTVIKAIPSAQCKIALFVVPTKASGKEGLYFATLSGGKFDGTRKSRARYWDYRTKDRSGDLDYCWGVGDFEALRKYNTEKVFIIAQDKAYATTPEEKSVDLFSRLTLIKSSKHWDRFGNAYIGKIELETTDGSKKRFEYEPYRTYRGSETKSADIADFIDKSGYLLRPRRFDLMEKAERLRKERAQAEASSADFTEATTELQDLICKARRSLSASVMACNDSRAADELSRKMDHFSRALRYFESYNDKLTSKKYASIDLIKSDIDTIKEKLNRCME